MQPTSTFTQQSGGPAAGSGLPPGTSRRSKSYIDEDGRQRTASQAVPVNQFGQISGIDWVCPKCKATRLTGLKPGGTPVCEADDRQMRRVGVKAASVLPWGALWSAVDRPLRAVWTGGIVAVAGVALDAAEVAAPALGVAAIPAGWAAYWAARKYLSARAERADSGPGAGATSAAIARLARTVGYSTVAGLGWLTVAAAAGLDPGTLGAQVSWALLPLAWIGPAATWWRYLREQAKPKPAPVVVVEPVEEPEPEFDGEPIDPDETQTRHIWSTIVSAAKGQVIGRTVDGDVLAPRTGKLVGTWLEDWHHVEGGWGATVASHPGDYTAEAFLGMRGAVASAFRMKASMITIIPDVDDETRALVLAQRISPIVDEVGWPGPGTIDVQRGVAPISRYADGEYATWEMWRPEWGCPHMAAFGTTGSAKSTLLAMAFAIGRWAHCTDADGRKRGIFADFLIDPQQGQSFAEFAEDLAAPPACSLPEAIMLVEALHAEMLRRNRYLARVEWYDPKRKKMRRGRKWWNPLVDGPILALTIDEAHQYLADKRFAALVVSAARMWRKCGGQIRIATHTPLLGDLGGSMALRDMLTGGFVWVGRTANSLSGPTAFNGRLPVDPRTIPPVPGLGYVLNGVQPKPMLARNMWVRDFYDWVRDANDEPIGYPAELPPETLAAFGPEYAAWVAAMRSGSDAWTPTSGPPEASDSSSPRSVDCVLSVLAAASEPLDMDTLDAELRRAGHVFSTRTARDALKKLRDQGLVSTVRNRHELTPLAREDMEAESVGQLELALESAE